MSPNTNIETCSFYERAIYVISRTFGGPHHVQGLKFQTFYGQEALTEEQAKDRARMCTFQVYGPISTFDFNMLTKLVVDSHDACVRAQVSPSQPNTLRVWLYDRSRKSKEPSVDSHPELEPHVAAIRKGSSRAMQELWDSMRAEEGSAS